MMPAKLVINLERSTAVFLPGEEISGTAEWHLADPPEKIQLGLLWFTQGKGDQDLELVQSLEFPAGTQGREEFSLLLPLYPYSFSGKLISLIWAVELTVFPSQEVVQQEIIVAPQKKEIDLYECRS